MTVKLRFLIVLFLLSVTVPSFAQSSNCEIVLMPEGGGVADGTFADAESFLETVYDSDDGHMQTFADLPIRAIICQREDIIPTMRDLPILKTGLPLSLSQDFESNSSSLLTLYDAGEAFEFNYVGLPLSESDEEKLRDTVEVFNLQKSIK